MIIGQFEKPCYLFPLHRGLTIPNTQSEGSLENQKKGLYVRRQGGGLQLVTTHLTTTHSARNLSCYSTPSSPFEQLKFKISEVHLSSASVTMAVDAARNTIIHQ